MTWLKIITAKLVVPSGLNSAYVADRVANMIASTIVHEAAHGDRWSKFFYTTNKSLNDMNRSEEERIADDKERSVNLLSDIEWNDPALYSKNSSNATIMTNEELLSKAIAIANSKMNFYIPPDRVEDVVLPPQAQGMFESTQDGVARSDVSPEIAWREADRTLMVDVTKIVQNYNNALASYQGQQESLPATYQQGEGQGNLMPGYTKRSPLSVSVPSAPSAPTRTSVPGRGAR